MKLIGLSGYGGVGKDTVADILVKEFGWEKFSFSDALYQEVAQGYGLPDASGLYVRETKEQPSAALALNQCYDQGFVRAMEESIRNGSIEPLAMNAPLSPRQVLQWWGTEYRRKQDPEYWLKRASDAMFASDAHGMVNVSVRFDNEAQWVWSKGGINIKVIRDTIQPPNNYVSELGVDKKYIDYRLRNDGTIDDLFQEVKYARALA
jgi:hypothetical protein